MAHDMNVKKINKFYEQEQSYSRIRSRFSDRSKGIMETLALGGLKMDKKNVQFLPQLSYKRLPRSNSKNSTSLHPITSRSKDLRKKKNP